MRAPCLNSRCHIPCRSMDSCKADPALGDSSDGAADRFWDIVKLQVQENLIAKAHEPSGRVQSGLKVQNVSYLEKGYNLIELFNQPKRLIRVWYVEGYDKAVFCS